jgi:hypothetical protein
MSRIIESMLVNREGGFGKNVEILMMNGTTKYSQDIKVGDILVGNDGHERIVEDIFSGDGNLYEIRQKSGKNYIVHSKHILVLKNIDEEMGIELDVEINPEQFCDISDALKSLLLGIKVNPRGEITTNNIKVIPIGWGPFYGFYLSGNNKFVGADFTVFNSC